MQKQGKPFGAMKKDRNMRTLGFISPKMMAMKCYRSIKVIFIMVCLQMYVLTIFSGFTPLLSYVNDAFLNFVEFVVKYPKKSLMKQSSKNVLHTNVVVFCHPFTLAFSDKPIVVWQSPTSIKVSSFRKAVTLYCVASNHGLCTYHWRKFGERGRFTFPSSPVVYVNEGGVYQCTIKSDDVEKEDTFSRTIRVYAQIGETINHDLNGSLFSVI